LPMMSPPLISGITATMDIPGFATLGWGGKASWLFTARRLRDFLSAVEQVTTAPEVAVIGGGVAGCEPPLAMAHALRRQKHPAAGDPAYSFPGLRLPAFGNLAPSAQSKQKLRRADIDNLYRRPVTKVRRRPTSPLHDGKKIPSRLTWVPAVPCHNKAG